MKKFVLRFAFWGKIEKYIQMLYFSEFECILYIFMKMMFFLFLLLLILYILMTGFKIYSNLDGYCARVQNRRIVF